MSRTALIAVVACLSVAIGATLGMSSSAPPSAVTPPPGTEDVPTTLDVHVAGWVHSPGVVELSEGAIVADAIEAAGGFRPGAASTSVNLAAPVHDGEQIYVSGPESTSGEIIGGGDDRVVINRAQSDELEALPGVGPVLAERIVAYREEHGPFRAVEDLLQVAGIGESKLASIRDLIRVP